MPWSLESPYVAVVGSGVADDSLARAAEELGRELARLGAVVVSGGMSGVMEAAARGAKSEGGMTLGILPGSRRSEANAFVDVAVATGMGEMRNALVVRAADAVVAVGGEFGTLSEIGLALKTGVPVVGLGTWELAQGGVARAAFEEASDPKVAARRAVELAAGVRGEGPSPS